MEKLEKDKEKGSAPKEYEYTWESGSVRPVLYPPDEERPRITIILILQGIALGITVLLLFLATLWSMLELLGGGWSPSVLSVLILLFFSALFQGVSMIFVRKRKYFSLALGGAVFGIYLFPLALVIIGMLIHQRRYFENRFEKRSFDR